MENPFHKDIEINSDRFISAGGHVFISGWNWSNQREVLTPQSIVASVGFYTRHEIVTDTF
jgi:hypothetical protein